MDAPPPAILPFARVRASNEPSPYTKALRANWPPRRPRSLVERPSGDGSSHGAAAAARGFRERGACAHVPQFDQRRRRSRARRREGARRRDRGARGTGGSEGGWERESRSPSRRPIGRGWGAVASRRPRRPGCLSCRARGARRVSKPRLGASRAPFRRTWATSATSRAARAPAPARGGRPRPRRRRRASVPRARRRRCQRCGPRSRPSRRGASRPCRALRVRRSRRSCRRRRAGAATSTKQN